MILFFKKCRQIFKIFLYYIKIKSEFYKKHYIFYTGCPKKVETPKCLGKYKFYRKMFQTKVIWFKNIYLSIDLISLILGCVAKVRSRLH